jgi:hypothetical protein
MVDRRVDDEHHGVNGEVLKAGPVLHDMSIVKIEAYGELTMV